MAAYYNEIDPYAAQWLRNLIGKGLIACGDVDERDIRDVRAAELRGYDQCHFFAGIGGWSVALRLAGWADDRPVWTGSCPCQPFSAAGAGKAADDERHLWPAWLPLIAECKPPVVFGEQVEAAIGWGWIDAVFTDLESEGYACGATVLPACSVGAPHIRQRLWFVADADGGNASAEGLQRSGQHGQRAPDGGAGMAHADSARRRAGRTSEASDGRDAPRVELAGLRDAGDMADATSGGLGEQWDASRPRSGGHVDGGFWSSAHFIACTDGKSRPVEPGSFPLAHGVQRRTSKLRAYGNAIVPQAAAEFIAAMMSTEASGQHTREAGPITNLRER